MVLSSQLPVQSVYRMMDGSWWNHGMSFIQQYYWIPLLTIVALLVMVGYLLLRPLNRVTVTESLEPIVQTRVRDQYSDQPKKRDAETVVREAHQARPIDVALQLLESDERTIAQLLVDEGGYLLQKDISWKTGYSRVKTHRILTRLIRRGVVTSEKYYNTNKISLSTWLLEHSEGSA